MGKETNSAQATVDAAVVPLNEVLVADVKMGAKRFDTWLRNASGGYVTLERLKQVCAATPVLGNIMAAVDVCGDIVTLVEQRNQRREALEQMLDWASLGINLIGVVPVPGTAAARMSLRPALGIVRQEIKLGAKDLGLAITRVIAGHITASLKGDLQPFVEGAKAKLQSMLTDSSTKAEQCLKTLADGLDHIAAGDLVDPNTNWRAASRHMSKVSGSALVRDPGKTLHSLYEAAWAANTASVKVQINVATSVVATVTPEAGRKMIRRLAADLRSMIPGVKKGIMSLAGEDVGTIMYMLNMVLRGIMLYGQRKAHVSATVKPKHPTQAKRQHKGNEVEVRRDEGKPGKPGPSRCKACAPGQPPPTTVRSIGYALGDESFDHTDFVLPGVLPIEWTRTYRSNFGAHDERGPLGPRWTTPWHASFEVLNDKLVYHDATGRSLDYPSLAIGHAHYDPIEQSTITRLSGTQIAIARGEELKETYEREESRFLLTKVADRSGNALVLTYTNGLLASIANTAGAVAVLTHDEHGRITEITLHDDAGEPTRRLAAYTYDESGDLTQAVDEDNATRTYAYSHHLITRYSDRTGRGMNLQWDSTHLDARAIREWADDGSFDTRLEWHERLRLTFVTDALGRTTQQYYDVDGYPYRIVHADKTEEWFFRDAAKNVTRRVHADGSEEHFTWDARSNLSSHTARDGRIEYFVHDDRDNLTGIQDAEGYRWERYYDSKGRVAEATDPLGRVTKYAYNAAGLPVEITDPKGGKKQIAWRPDGQIESFTDCSGKATAWTYDDHARLAAVQNAAGETTRYEYEGSQLIALVRPDKTRETFERDAEGRLLVHTDALKRQTRYRYTAAGLIAARENAQGDELAYIWNRLGQIEGLRNENGSEHRFEYDEAGRLIAEKGFDGKTTRYFRDAGSGELTHQLDGDVLQSFEHDAMGRVARRRGWKAQFTDKGRVFLEPQGAIAIDEESFAYDGLGRLLQADNAHSRLRWSYDPVGNLESEQLRMQMKRDTREFAWQHEYNELDVRVASVRPDGHRVDWLTYGSGHVHGMLLDGLSVAEFERDDGHREIVRELRNELKQTTAYDEAGRLAHQVLQGTSGKLLERRYEYDAAGQLEQIADMRRGELRYAYDPIGRLTRAQSSLGVETFAFDPASNLQEPSERDAHGIGLIAARATPALLDNLIKDYAGTHYTYDKRGNLQERTVNGAAMTFEWDSFNRMVSASNWDMSVRYLYDALGRRIAKLAQAVVPVRPSAGSGWQEHERTRINAERGYGLTLYGWEGDTLAYETSERDKTTTHYVYEPGSFTPLMQAKAAAGVMLDDSVTKVQPIRAAAYYHCDQIGTPQELTDSDGELAWSAKYRAWGEAKEAISEAARKAGIGNPLRFAGQYHDAETGLHFNRHRYYDPKVGRFISKDPIGLAGGVNVYQYAPNPVNWADPLGLSPCPGRKGAFRQAKRDLGLLMGQQPNQVLNQKTGKMGQYNQVMMTGRDKLPVLGANGQPTWTREYEFTKPDGQKVIIQDHSAGHEFNEDGVGDQDSHFNTRPCNNTRTGKVVGTMPHYPFGAQK